MNKKIVGIIVTVLIIFLCVFGFNMLKNSETNNNSSLNNSTNNGNNDQNNDGNASNEDNRQNNNNGNLNQTNTTAVIYFSATGTTKKVAVSLSETLKSDLIEIVPEEKYSNSDLNYNDSNSRVSKEHDDSSNRPAIANSIDISKYETIYLGYPIWWDDAPRIIYGFLDKYDLKTKKLFLFSTSASSGITTSVNNIKNYQKDINIINSKRFSSSFTDKDITDFISNN